MHALRLTQLTHKHIVCFIWLSLVRHAYANQYPVFLYRSSVSFLQRLLHPKYSHYTTKILIPAWISNDFHCKMWDEIIYPFPNVDGAIVYVITYPCWDLSQIMLVKGSLMFFLHLCLIVGNATIRIVDNVITRPVITIRTKCNIHVKLSRSIPTRSVPVLWEHYQPTRAMVIDGLEASVHNPLSNETWL